MHKKIVYIISCIFLCVVVAMYILSSVSVVQTVVEADNAFVTINFITPMEQANFDEHIKIVPAFADPEDINIQTKWINENTLALLVTETGDIKGQNVDLIISNADSTYPFINKNRTIHISFDSTIQVLEPTEQILIASDNSFEVHFNTPIALDSIQKYLQSEAAFDIEPLNSSKITEDLEATKFKFTPKTELENNKLYSIVFKKGLTSSSNNILEQSIEIQVLTDQEPTISKISPENDSKWVGLYPKISITAEVPIKEANLHTQNGVLSGEVISDYKAVFYYDDILTPSTYYENYIQIISHSGEKSKMYPLNFNTVPVKDDRIWITITQEEPSMLRVYQGQTVVREIGCSMGEDISAYQKGTYYVLEKGETFLEPTQKIGANKYLTLSEGIVIHGPKRDEYWNIIESSISQLGHKQTGDNVVISEEDSIWLFENIPYDTMVIVK
ncbi:MAG: hypothetical protein BEN19_06460 [Epulopiscium sp. Nuni2H_MBin003]|nr:MAG: hypothetical protein BEN19_06460 [Epulopiscium sp. Nuni2H_MBin003]